MVRSIVTSEELEAVVRNEKNKGKLIVLDFFAQLVNQRCVFFRTSCFSSFRWCGPCNNVAPKIEEWSKGDFKNKVVFLKCDIDQARSIPMKFRVESMPTFVFFKNGREIHRVVGGNTENLKADIERKTK